jgi:hypothetical protein
MRKRRLFNTIEQWTSGTYFLWGWDQETGRHSKQTLPPDSPEWFTWLATLPSFSFTTAEGYHFTARREKIQQGKGYWYAYRKVHQQLHKRYLGTTEKLTLTHLETTARSLHEAALQSLPEDRRVSARTHRKALPEELSLGALTITWQNGMLTLQASPTDTHVLTRAQTAELLSYLYERRGVLLNE